MENQIDKRHFQDMEKLSERLEQVQAKSSKADMWNKIKNGFEKVKASSFAGTIASLVGIGATMVYGAHVNGGTINVDLATPLMTSVALGYGSIAAMFASHKGGEAVSRKVSTLSSDLNKDTISLRNDANALSQDINLSSKTNGVSEKKATEFNELYDKVFSKSLNTPLQKEQEKHEEKKKTKGLKYT